MAGTTLDLGVVSNVLAAKTTFKVSDLSSDHFAFRLDIGVPAPPAFIPRPRLDLEQADWRKVNREIETLCINNPPSTCPDYGRMVLQALRTCVPTKTGRPRTGRWYQRKSVRLAKRDYNYVLRKFRKRPSAELKTTLSLAFVHFRDTCTVARDARWKAWCSSFNWASSLKDLWNRINLVAGKCLAPPLHPNPLARARDLARGFADRTVPESNLTPEHLQMLDSLHAEREVSIMIAINTASTRGLDGPFRPREVVEVLCKLKDSAAGPDMIPNKIWTRLDTVGRVRLTNLLSNVFVRTEIPASWKCGKVIPIPKAGSNDMRPITLLDTMGKVLERLILKRMEAEMSSKNIRLPGEMYGFRKRRGCQHCVTSLMEQIFLSRQRRMDQVVIFLDLEKAFELIDHQTILYALAQQGIGGKLLAYVKSYLKNRSLEVTVQGVPSGPVQTKNGVPQGAVLSPFLFNLVVGLFHRKLMTKLVSILGKDRSKKVSSYTYADDLAFHCRDKTDAMNIARATLQCTHAVSLEMGFKISKQKSKAMHMFNNSHPTIRIGDTELEWVKTYKYLGIILDNNLTLIPLVISLADRMRKRINIMHRISGFNWGASGEVLRMFYKATTRALVDYAAPILAYGLTPRKFCAKSWDRIDGKFKTAFDMLERVQYQAARCILGVARPTRVEILLLETGLEPLHLRVRALTGTFLAKFAAGVDSQLAASVSKYLEHQDRARSPNDGERGRQDANLSRSIRSLLDWATQNLKVTKCDVAPLNRRMPWYRTPCKVLANLPGKKAEVPAHILRATAMEEIDRLRTRYPEAYNIYTDGSLNPDNGRAGAAVVCNQDGRVCIERATDFSSTLTVELLAIQLALHVYDKKSVIIHTDSINAIYNVMKNDTESSIAADTRARIQQRDDNSLTTVLHWVPSHVGVPGNEQADRAANRALHINEITLLSPISASQNTLNAKRGIKTLWEASLEPDVIRLPQSNSWTWYNKLRKIIPPCMNAMSKNYLSVASRIRSGHRRFKDCPAYAQCACGLAVFSIPHVMISCPLIDHSPLDPHRQAALSLNLGEIDTAIEIIRVSSKEGWGELVDFYVTNIDTINK